MEMERWNWRVGKFQPTKMGHFQPTLTLKRSEVEALIERIKAGLAPGGVAYVAAFTTEDPGYRRCRERGLPEVEPNTFFSAKRGMHLFYVAEGELKDFFDGFELLSYAEGYSLDLAHGEPHHHGWASILAKRP